MATTKNHPGAILENLNEEKEALEEKLAEALDEIRDLEERAASAEIEKAAKELEVAEKESELNEAVEAEKVVLAAASTTAKVKALLADLLTNDRKIRKAYYSEKTLRSITCTVLAEMTKEMSAAFERNTIADMTTGVTLASAILGSPSPICTTSELVEIQAAATVVTVTEALINTFVAEAEQVLAKAKQALAFANTALKEVEDVMKSIADQIGALDSTVQEHHNSLQEIKDQIESIQNELSTTTTTTASTTASTTSSTATTVLTTSPSASTRPSSKVVLATTEGTTTSKTMISSLKPSSSKTSEFNNPPTLKGSNFIMVRSLHIFQHHQNSFPPPSVK